MDERVVTVEKCWNGIEEQMPGDLNGSELNDLVESVTRLNAFEGEIWKCNQKVVMDDKINQ